MCTGYGIGKRGDCHRNPTTIKLVAILFRTRYSGLRVDQRIFVVGAPLNAATKLSNSGGRYPIPPGRYDVERFKTHVIKTGRPETWTDLSLDQPPPDSEFLWLCDFEIPTKLRPTVGKAPCPICSPNAPKYFKGSLCWYPAEATVRAVGQECGHKHHGSALAVGARRQGERRWIIQEAEDYLLSILPNIDEFRDDAVKFQRQARELDKCIRKMQSGSSKSAIKRFAKLGHSGYLPVYQYVTVTTVDAFGQQHETTEPRLTASYRVNTAEFLCPRILHESKAIDSLNGFNAIPQFHCDDEILDFIAEGDGNFQKIIQVKQIIVQAFDARAELMKTFDDARKFFNFGNLTQLEAWCKEAEEDAPFRLFLDSDRPKEFRLAKKGQTRSKSIRVTIPEFLSRG